MLDGNPVRHVVLAASAGLLAISVALPAGAQGSYRAVPTGGRSALMGNTGVALARDGSAPFLNPAAIAAIADPRVAFSVNLFSLTATSVDRFHAPRGTDAGLGRESLSDSRLEPIPSTFCFFVTLGKGDADPDVERRKLALCAGTSERRDLNGAASATGNAPDGTRSLHLASIARSYARVHVGPTYAVPLSDKLAIGASLHIVDTRVTSLTTASATSVAAAPGTDTTVPAATSSLTSSINATSFDIAALLGATYDVDRSTTVGLAFAPPNVHVGGDIDASDTAHQTGAGLEGGVLARARAGSGRFASPLPMRVAAGLGVHGKRSKIEVDATYFFASPDAFRSDIAVHSVTTRGAVSSDRSEPVVATVDEAGVLDSSIGGELMITDEWSILGGFATDFGGVRALAPTSTLGSAVTYREDRALVTLGVGNYGGDGSELLVGVQLGAARGEIMVADSYAVPADLAPAKETTSTILFVIAGSTNLASLKKTLDQFRRPSR